VASTIDIVIAQHAELAAHLWGNRRIGVTAPNWALKDLARFDERVEANIDGLRVAGEPGWRESQKLLEMGNAQGVFPATALAIEAGDQRHLYRLLALAEASPPAWAGVGAALAWVSSGYLKGTVKALLDSDNPSVSRLGVSACIMHRVDPGAYLDGVLAKGEPGIGGRVAEAIARFGRRASVNGVLKATAGADGASRSWGALSAVVLGDRGMGLGLLHDDCLRPSPFRIHGLEVLLRVLDSGSGRDVLRSVAQEEPKDPRILVQGAGMIGDPGFVPWLLERMEEGPLARIAGQAFALLTGADLSLLDLEREPPDDVGSGQADSPDDGNVALDPDTGLPWPDPEKVRVWWRANQHRFQGGQRYFMGQPPNPDTCQRVLREGYQRQRVAAALYLALLRPGTPLFPTAAPAWRQRRWLAGASF
jgi:uncharacterized protein (TIGR02270 family)